MNTQLLIIDPQNDFMDIKGAALPVPGATADMQRLAHLIRELGHRIDGITVTLDSHHFVGIERTTFWRRRPDSTNQFYGVAPFTEVTAADVRAGRFWPARVDDFDRTLEYLDELEKRKRYKLVVWPVHCEIGTWGHNVYDQLRVAYNAWELSRTRAVQKVFKGTDPWTESYSAIRTEVPGRSSGSSEGVRLAERLAQADRLWVAGEASSHCVRATVEDLLHYIPAHKVVLLSDCMSPVPGFEAHAAHFQAEALEQGAQICKSTDLVAAEGHGTQFYRKPDVNTADRELSMCPVESVATDRPSAGVDAETPTQDDRVRHDNALRQIWAAFDDWSEQEKGLARTVWWHAEHAALASPVGTTIGRETLTVADQTDSSRVDWLHGWADLRLETWFEADKGIEHRISRNGWLIGAGRTLREAIDAARSPSLASPAGTAQPTTSPAPASEAVVQDAERGRFVVNHAAWIRHEGRTYLQVRVPDGSDLSCVATREMALDAALNTQGERNGD